MRGVHKGISAQSNKRKRANSIQKRIDQDGKYQVATIGSLTNATQGGYWYYSSDFGNTWKNPAGGNLNMQMVAMSTNGAVQTIVNSGGTIFTYHAAISKNFANTFSQGINATGATSKNFKSIAMSASGKDQYIGNDVGEIFKSSNFGNTFSLLKKVIYSSARSIVDIAVSGNGQYVSVLFSPSTATIGVLISSDYGNSFLEKSYSSTTSYSKSIAMSANGQYQTIVGLGKIFISSDYGNNWATINYARDFYSVDISETGQYQTAVSIKNSTNNYNPSIYISSDYGNTWNIKGTEIPSTVWWTSVSMSADGSKQTAVSISNFTTGNRIYTSSDYGNTWVQKSPNDLFTSVAVQKILSSNPTINLTQSYLSPSNVPVKNLLIESGYSTENLIGIDFYFYPGITVNNFDFTGLNLDGVALYVNVGSNSTWRLLNAFPPASSGATAVAEIYGTFGGTGPFAGNLVLKSGSTFLPN